MAIDMCTYLWLLGTERSIIHDRRVRRRSQGVLRPSSDAQRGAACENGPVSDDWLEHGHEMSGTNLTPVFSSSTLLAEGAGAPTPRPRTSGWRAVLVGGGLALLATLGVVGVANAISDNLFPSMGATRPESVWQNPVPPTEPAPTSVVVPTTETTTPTTTSTSTPTSTVPTVTATTTATARSTTPSTSTAGSSSRPVTTALSPTTSALDHGGSDDSTDDKQLDDKRVDDKPVDDEPVDDDLLADNSGSSSGSGSSGSGSSGSGSSGSGSGSDD
jgi:uncharacterized membrane protein YgcG